MRKIRQMIRMLRGDIREGLFRGQVFQNAVGRGVSLADGFGILIGASRAVSRGEDPRKVGRHLSVHPDMTVFGFKLRKKAGEGDRISQEKDTVDRKHASVLESDRFDLFFSADLRGL